MKPSRWFLVCAVAIALVEQAGAGPQDYVFRDMRLCAEAGDFCFSGTLLFERNPRLLRLRARVQTAPGPGLLQIWLIGQNRLGHRRLAPFEVRVRGNPTEIINHKIIPDHPDVPTWSLDRIEFVADGS